jgi:hypothetical protein
LHLTALPKKSLLRQLYTRLLYILGVIAILVVAGEITARVLGHRPWKEPHQAISIQPEGSFYVADSVLGYRGKPGRFALRLQDSLDFTVTHDSAGWRQSHTLPDSLPQIWIFGCSFTHGFGVNDAEAYPAQLQGMLPGYHVRNFGMDAYGTLQNWLTLRDLLRKGEKPALIILAYGAFHDQRNTANRYWRKALHGQQIAEGITYPYIRLDENDSLHITYQQLEYHPLPLQRHLAMLSLLEENWNRSEDEGLRSKHVTEILIQRMANASHHAGAQFVLAGIYKHPETVNMLRTFHTEGIHTVDISQDLEHPSARILPGNGHPNAASHRKMAEALHSYLMNKLLHKPS